MVALLAPAASCQDKRTPIRNGAAQRANTMIEIVKSNGQADPPKVTYTPGALADGSGGTRGAAPSVPGYLRALGSSEQNSRSPGAFPESGEWTRAWEAPLEGAPIAALVAANRIVVQQGGGWTLFSREGKQVTQGLSGAAPITLDPSAGLFYSVGAGFMLQAHALENGELRFKIPLGHNEAFSWRLLYRSGTHMVAAAAEQKLLSPKGYPPTQSLIQVIDVATPIQVSPYKILLSLNSQEELIFQNPTLVTAASRDIIWAALPNLLVRTSPSQEIGGAWADTFEPLVASTDEAGWLHLVVGIGERRELWVVTPEGKRTLRVELLVERQEVAGPPAIGFDRRIYLWAGRRVSAFDPAGKHLWDAQTEAPVVGLSVTPNGFVLAGGGRAVYAIDPRGQVTAIEVDDRVTAAPVMTSEGHLIVAGESKLMGYRRGR
jgi:hypothetical protein